MALIVAVAKVATLSFSGCSTHHLEELIEVDFSVTVLIDLVDGGLKLFLRVHRGELVAGKKLEELLLVDPAATVGVKHLEGCFQVALTKEHRGIHSSRQKLCISNSLVT